GVVGEGLHVLARGDVECPGAGLAAGRLDVGDQRVEAVDAARAQHHGGAALGQQPRGGFADAAAGAGDQHDLVLDVVHVDVLWVVGRRDRTACTPYWPGT